MTDTAIQVENLGKKFIIRHDTGPQARYNTLTDVLTQGASTLLRRLRPRSAVTQREQGRWEEFWAVRDVGFDVPQGQVLGIVGRNGAGKSTLLKMLCRITEPTTGRIRIRGRISSLLEVGTGFHPELSGRENIFLNGAILGMSKAEIRARFDEIVAFAEVERFLDTPVKRFSSGMYVRLAFAVAAHLEPEILIVDEVLAVGDIAFQRKCLGKMDEVSRRDGRTILFVSHNMATLSALCSRAILLERGQLVDDGPATEVVDEYQRRILAATDTESEAQQSHYSEQKKIGVRKIRTAVVPGDGAKVDLQISMEIFSDIPHRQVGVGIDVSVLGGVRVARIAPYMTHFLVDEINGSTQVVFTCPDVGSYLAGGDYLVSLWLARPRIEQLLRVEEAGRFTIPPRDMYGTGVYYEWPQHGVVPLPMKFQILSESSAPALRGES